MFDMFMNAAIVVCCCFAFCLIVIYAVNVVRDEVGVISKIKKLRKKEKH